MRIGFRFDLVNKSVGKPLSGKRDGILHDSGARVAAQQPSNYESI